MKKSISLFLLLAVVIIFFRQFFLHGLLPIPSDTLVGLYNPFRDIYAQQYPRGTPFKNFLTTDPIRQQYPWRELAISLEKHFSLPIWNPYTFSGSPLLANFQTAAFYPLNIFFFILPFPYAWSLLVFLQPLLAGIFLYLYLKNLKLHPLASFLGAVSFAFSGFFMAWLEWNTVGQTLLWLPLMLLSIDKVLGYLQEESSMKSQGLMTVKYIWLVAYIFSLTSSFFAGHLQTFFYVFLIQLSYLAIKFFGIKSKKFFFIFFFSYVIFLVLTAIQWIPTLEFIFYSARSIDVNYLTAEGWFVPWQHLVQFIAPDFFGNPTTLNYWGVWNYGEFVGYIGVFPLLLSLFAIIARHDKKTYFFTVLSVIALLFALPTPIAVLPFSLHIPFFSTAQPTRLIGIIDLALAILAALGFDTLLKERKIRIPLFSALITLAVIFVGVWVFVLKLYPTTVSVINLSVAKHNLLFPTSLFVSVMSILIFFVFFRSLMPRKIQIVIFCVLVLISVIDQLRFADKFTPFTLSEYLYPSTTALTFLQQHQGNFRYMTTDSQIIPPNVSTIYRLQTIEGYDPLYLERYGAFIAAMQRNRPDASTPFGFNRIIVPHNTTSSLINLLGVKYVLSLNDLHENSFTKVFEEGQTKIYQNNNVLPRTFFVTHVVIASSKEDAIGKIFAYKSDLENTAIVENTKEINSLSSGLATITYYLANDVTVKTQNKGKGFLVLTDVYYPSWRATIDGKAAPILLTDFTFRGVLVPQGIHKVVFSDHLF